MRSKAKRVGRGRWERPKASNVARLNDAGRNGGESVGRRRGGGRWLSPRLAAAVEPVHERQQGGNDGVVNLVLLGAPHRRKSVDLVEEDDGRLVLGSLLEQHPKLPLRLPHPFREEVSTCKGQGTGRRRVG